MRYAALASDYDGTLAARGIVAPDVVLALRRLVESGRRLVIVTGRQLDDLLAIFPESKISERIVAENGAVLYAPATQRVQVLAEPPSIDLVAELGRRGVRPLSIGRVVVGTDRANEDIVLDAIATLGLRLRVERNKDALMVLPDGVTKATGLRAALIELSVEPEEVVGIGDAENDTSMLELCRVGVAVANALDSVKGRADRVTRAANGAGVLEVIDWLLAEDPDLA